MSTFNMDEWRGIKSSGKSVSTSFKRCADTHKPLPIEVNGETYKVHGGSVYSTRSPKFDVVVALDTGHHATAKAFPWTDGHEFQYPIRDGKAPKDTKTFKQLVTWLGERILAGDKVFVGCIGGHGRTGMVLTALVAHMTGMKDATTYVRENYCKKAVESTSQVNFLKKHYAVTKVEPTKPHSGYTSGSWSKKSKTQESDIDIGDGDFWKANPWGNPPLEDDKAKGGTKQLQYVPTDHSIHGDNAILVEEPVDKTLIVV